MQDTARRHFGRGFRADFPVGREHGRAGRILGGGRGLPVVFGRLFVVGRAGAFGLRFVQGFLSQRGGRVRLAGGFAFGQSIELAEQVIKAARRWRSGRFAGGTGRR